LKIAISARGLAQSQGGVKEYIRNLIQQFPQVDSGSEFTIYYSDPGQMLGLTCSNVKEVALRSAPNLIWDHWILPMQLKRDKIDVTLFPKGAIPIWHPGKAVVTEHDLGYFFPGLNAYKKMDTLYAQIMIPRAVRRAGAVVAVSHHTRGDILRFVQGADYRRIFVTYEAAPIRDHGNCDPNFAERMMSLGPYVFFSGSLSPRKNMERALKAFGLIKDQVPHKFVITGGKRWGKDVVENLIGRSGLADRVVLLGYLDDAELAYVYKKAALYLMPSLYEGFSMTVLEAMVAGCPVVASNVSSHPEVVGDAGLLFDPYDVHKMAETMMQVIKNEELQRTLRERGFEQASQFSWRKCAEETLAVIKRVGSGGAD